jgi:hypothetical protein
VTGIQLDLPGVSGLNSNVNGRFFPRFPDTVVLSIKELQGYLGTILKKPFVGAS